MMNISKQKFTAVLGLLPVLLDRLHPVELGQSHLPHLAVHQGCPTNLPETFHPGSFVLYFWPFLSSPIHRVLFSNIPAYFQWQNEKWYANRRCLLKINHDGYEQIPFSLILVVAMGISLKKKNTLHLQGAFFNCSSHFSVPKWKTLGSQSEILFNEIVNIKKVLVGWTTFFFLVLKLGQNTEKIPWKYFLRARVD